MQNFELDNTSIIIFVVGTIAIIFYSWWMSIKERRYHGIPRFFSFESILILIIINKSHWFRNPLSPLQIISWLCLITSAIMAVYGFHFLLRFGRPQGKFENTTTLVKEGPYKYIRHPLYCSVLLLGLGAYLKKLSPLASILIVITIATLTWTAKMEEHEMLQKFGDKYEAYMRETRMFIPFIF